MDNRQFNINGKTKQQLKLAVKCLLLSSRRPTPPEEYVEDKVRGWYFLKEKGIVLTWFVGDGCKAAPFTDGMGKPKVINSDELSDILWDWLSSDEAKTVIFDDWDRNSDHDGSNELGWRLYTEDWGHISKNENDMDRYSIAAFRPSWLWYGK